MTVLEDVKPVARKQHRCDVCDGVIGEGDRYHRQRGVWEGEPYTHKAHLLCRAAYVLAMRDLERRADWDEYAEPDEVRPYVERFFAAVISCAGTLRDGGCLACGYVGPARVDES